MMKRTLPKRLVQVLLMSLFLVMGSQGARAENGDFLATTRIEAYAIASEGAYVYIVGDAINLSEELPGDALDLRGGMKDIWLVKLDREGTPVFSALIGGADDDVAYDLAVKQGVVYILGETWSTDFPGAPGNAGENDTIVLALAADGSGILWARRLGGSDQDSGRALALHDEALYLTGISWSQDLVPGEAKGNADGFLARLGLDGSLDWTQIFGGRDLDAPFDMAVSGESLWVAGQTLSSDFAGRNLGQGDAFTARFNLDGARQSVGLYGGAQEDIAYALTSAPGGGVYLAGATKSSNLEGANGSYSGLWDGLFMSLDSGGNVLATSYLGGTGIEYVHDMVVAPNGNMLVTGRTTSPTFPLGYETTEGNLGGEDAFIVQLNPSGDPLSVWLKGGDDDDAAMAAAINAYGLWLAGDFSIGDLGYVILMPPPDLVGITLPTPQPLLPTATLALTATPQPTEPPLATPLPDETLTTTAEANATPGEPPLSTASATPTQESASVGEKTPSQTLSADETKPAAAGEEIPPALTHTAVVSTATAQIEAPSPAEKDAESTRISSGFLIGGGLLIATGLGVAYTLIQRKKKNQ